MIPKEWDIQPLSEIATVTSGGTPSRTKPEYWQNGTVPWIRTTEVQNCVLNPEDVKEYISEQGLKNSSAKLVPAGTILLAMIGQGKTRGQVALLKFEASTNQNAATIVFNKDQEPEFHFNFLLGQYKNIRGMSNSAGQSNLSGALVKAIKVPVPPLPEQKKIAQILSIWDKAITTTEQLLANSQQQKKALMQQLLTGKKRLLDNSGSRFSGEFKRYQFSEVLEVDVKSISSKTPDNFEFNYISLSDVERGVINKKLDRHSYKSAPSRARRVVSEKDILLATVRPNLQAFAQITKENTTCIASTGFSVLTAKDDTCSDYVYQYLFSAHITGQINALVVGTNYPAINSSDVLGLNIYCPKLEEQQKIASVLSSIDQEIDSLQKKIEALKQEKKAMMQQLLTGKRRVVINNKDLYK